MPYSYQIGSGNARATFNYLNFSVFLSSSLLRTIKVLKATNSTENHKLT